MGSEQVYLNFNFAMFRSESKKKRLHRRKNSLNRDLSFLPRILCDLFKPRIFICSSIVFHGSCLCSPVSCDDHFHERTSPNMNLFDKFTIVVLTILWRESPLFARCIIENICDARGILLTFSEPRVFVYSE